MVAKREATPALKAVHDHWASKVSGGQAAYWHMKLGWEAVENIQEGEGKWCYACGGHKRLQRCHIIPHQFGGSMEPSNLFLMCLDCHASNPDGMDRDVFFSFVKHRESWSVRTYKALHASFTSLLETHPRGKDVKRLLEVRGTGFNLIDPAKLVVGIGVNNATSPASWAGAAFMSLVETVDMEKVKCAS